MNERGHQFLSKFNLTKDFWELSNPLINPTYLAFKTDSKWGTGDIDSKNLVCVGGGRLIEFEELVLEV